MGVSEDKRAQSVIIVAVPVDKSEFWMQGPASRECTNGHKYSSAAVLYCSLDGKEVKERSKTFPTPNYEKYLSDTGLTAENTWHIRFRLGTGSEVGLINLSQHFLEFDENYENIGWGKIFICNELEGRSGYHNACAIDYSFTAIENDMKLVQESAIALNLKSTIPNVYLSTWKYR